MTSKSEKIREFWKWGLHPITGLYENNQVKYYEALAQRRSEKRKSEKNGTKFN